VALDRKNPAVLAAYLNRMIDFGLPELAYHQAETLTTLQADNGLAWGVVSYVNARKGQMLEAISAVTLAGQFTPENQFVQRTAGEILAWYDSRGDKAQLPPNDKEGMRKVRDLLQRRPAFIQGYETAKRAYQGQGNSQLPPPNNVPEPAGTNKPAQGTGFISAPLSQENPIWAELGNSDLYPSTVHEYREYDPGEDLDESQDTGYYVLDWGPDWAGRGIGYWWQPAGYFAGCQFRLQMCCFRS
jgi:hypothetical protein